MGSAAAAELIKSVIGQLHTRFTCYWSSVVLVLAYIANVLATNLPRGFGKAIYYVRHVLAIDCRTLSLAHVNRS